MIKKGEGRGEGKGNLFLQFLTQAFPSVHGYEKVTRSDL